jgi:DNA topoisomerase-1
LRTLGTNPAGKEVTVKTGRYGPYVTDGETNCSVPKRFTPEGITLEEAVELLEKKKTSPKRAWRGKKKG